MSKYRIEPLDQDCDGDGFPEWDDHPLRGGFAGRLYPTVNSSHGDCSFQVIGPAGPVIRVRATKGPDELSYWGLPMLLASKQGAESKHIRNGLSAALDHLTELARNAGITRVVIGTGAGAEPDPLAAQLVDRMAEGTVQASAMIDLTRPTDALRADIRDSYRSLTNWGQRSIAMKYANALNPDRALFDLFPEFHAKVAGGRRRGDDYWGVYWDEIAAGRGELALGRLEDGTLVAGSIVVWAGVTAYYASGVYDRDQFDKPLGHWPLWNTILRAQEIGLARFDLGEIPARGHASDKELNIAFFKRGFTSGRHLRLRWVLSVQS
ncbi:MAG: GNAT family N-acetyltransferase [Magnetospirillum sp.]|nr:GNAT family N-acetyltransferase [Magnetospirillum sp.]